MKKLYLLSLLSVLLSGCGHENYDQTAEEVYYNAKKAFDNGRYDRAAELFNRVDKEFFASPWAPKAIVMEAYSYFMDSGSSPRVDHYDEAAALLDTFAQMHTNHQLMPYALYLKAMCYYMRINEATRHQLYTEKAIASFQALMNRFPKSKYAKDAHKKIARAKYNLWLKEYTTATHLLKCGTYVGAINRLQELYAQTTDKTLKENALSKLVEAYTKVGAINLAEETLQSLRKLAPKYPKLAELQEMIAETTNAA